MKVIIDNNNILYYIGHTLTVHNIWHTIQCTRAIDAAIIVTVVNIIRIINEPDWLSIIIISYITYNIIHRRPTARSIETASCRWGHYIIIIIIIFFLVDLCAYIVFSDTRSLIYVGEELKGNAVLPRSMLFVYMAHTILYIYIIRRICDNVLFSKTSHRLSVYARRPTKSLKPPFFDRGCIYFFSSQKPYFVIIIIVVVVVAADDGRPRFVRRRRRVAWPERETTRRRGPRGIRIHVYAYKTTLSVGRRVVKQSHPTICAGDLSPAPKPPKQRILHV